ncbi:MAG: cobalamin-binding protein [Chloroflexi bacterium]|nr:cobalamin-binding protein [Chloroflexota bacterium]
MRRKTLLTTILTLVVISLLAACAPAPAQPAPVPATPTSAKPATSFPLSITDSLGREVTLAAQPQRIVSLAPSNTEILFAVGAGDQVVGVTKFCNYPPEAKTREQIGGFSAKTISVEKIVALKPDLVLSAGKIQQPVIEALEQAKIPVVALDPQTFDDVYAGILTVGQLTGHKKEADTVVTQMKSRIAAVQAQVKDIPADQRPTVFWEVWDEPLMTAGPTTFTGQMIELAGATNIFSDVKEQYPQVSAEEVISRNPAVILGPDSHAEALTAEKVKARPGWGNIRAVQDGRIYLIDGDIASRPGPRLADGVEAIAKALYPQK